VQSKDMYLTHPSSVQDGTVYWAISGWDLNLLLDAEAPVEALRSFLLKYPKVPDVRLVQYALAVRLARENEYDEAAEVYTSIGAKTRASRMRQLASLSGDVRNEAKYKMAEYHAANSDRIYFNDRLWGGLQ